MIKTKRCAPDRGTDKKRGLKSPRGFAAAHLVKAIYFLEDLQPLGHGCPEAADFSPLSRTAQSADLSFPIITQGFNPGVLGEPAAEPLKLSYRLSQNTRQHILLHLPVLPHIRKIVHRQHRRRVELHHNIVLLRRLRLPITYDHIYSGYPQTRSSRSQHRLLFIESRHLIGHIYAVTSRAQVRILAQINLLAVRQDRVQRKSLHGQMPLHFLIHLYLQQGITVIVTTSHILSRNQLSNRSASIARYIGRLPISDGPNHPFNHQKAEFPAGMLLFYNDFRRMTKSPIQRPKQGLL